MGRAYYALGDRERAERAFRAVLASDPPAGARAVAARYLERLEGAPAAAARPFAAYVEATLGRDSNVNAAATAGGLLVPLALATREADGFAALGAGVALARALDPTYTLFGSVDVRQRLHFERDEFDSLAADLRLGAQARLSERDRLRVALEHDEYDQDHDGLRRTQGIGAQWQRRLAQAEVSAYAQALRIRYRQAALESESSELLLAGVRLARAFGPLAATASLYAGHDDATHGRTDGDRALAGLGATLERQLAARLSGHAGVSYQHSDYRRDNPAIGARREDRLVALELGASWRFAREWLLRPQLVRTHNRSNVPLTEYGRTEASISVRRVCD